MTGACTPEDHAYVVAGGTCAACGLPVQASGPLPATGDAPAWFAPPFGDPTTSAACRGNGGGPHAPAHAVGTCTSCSAGLDALGDPTGATTWVDGLRT